MSDTTVDLFLIARSGLPVPAEALMAADLGVEVQDFVSPLLLEHPDERLAGYRSQLAETTIRRSMHGAIFDLTPASPDPRVVDVTRLRYRQSIAAAQALNADMLVLHSQMNPCLMSSYRDQIISLQIDFWHELLAEAGDVTILLENVFDERPDDLAELLNRVGAANLGACLDVGHVLAYSSVPIGRWIERLGSHLRYVHLHETSVARDEHRPPSPAFLERVVDDLAACVSMPTVTLEYKTDDPLAEVARVRRAFDGH